MTLAQQRTVFDARNPIYESAKLSFVGVDDFDVYNPSIPFSWKGKLYMFGRVERRQEWARSWVRLFECSGPDVWTLVKDSMIWQLEDPYISDLGETLVLGGTHVRYKAGQIDTYYGYFYRGTELDDLFYFTTGPDRMKDIRLVRLADGRIGVFSRPRGDRIKQRFGSESMVGFAIINSLDDLTAEVVERAPYIDNLFRAGEWGGCNQAYLLSGGNIGVIGHKGYRTADENGQELLVYLVIAFVLEVGTNRVLDQKVIATRKSFPDGPAKKTNLADCAFPAGITARRDGLVDLYSGIGDCEVGRVTIEYPFAGHGALVGQTPIAAPPAPEGKPMPLRFTYLPQPALEPKPGCPWADTMVLNPAIVPDPQSKTLHMLFRATGPWPQKRMEGSPFDPYPIFLGYARSEDGGKSWNADFARPALAPALEYEAGKITTEDDEGNKVINHANGCIEDPRIFEVDGQLFLTAACRMFPPGPYWESKKNNVDTHTNRPKWSRDPGNPYGKAATANDTVTVLYRLDLDSLKAGDYTSAFQYVCNLTDPEVDDNRDVFLFPERMMIQGRLQYVLLHRPHNPEKFPEGKGHPKPSIMMAAAERIKDFAGGQATHHFLAEGIFDWEEERIGASWPPLKINEHEWLLGYHGKTFPGYGYTQSFLILRNRENDFPEIVHRCPDRLMYAQQDWELPDRFPCPCLFTTAGILVGKDLVMAYGAADQKIGLAWVDFEELVAHVRQYDAFGVRR